MIMVIAVVLFLCFMWHTCVNDMFRCMDKRSKEDKHDSDN